MKNEYHPPAEQIRRLSRLSPVKKWILILTPILALAVSLCCGRFLVHPASVAAILRDQLLQLLGMTAAGGYSEFELSAVMGIRLPRILLGMAVGAGLAMAGAALQGIFGNPLVSPQILGVSSGAGFGAALAILLWDSLWMTQLLSVVMGLAALGVTYAIGNAGSRTPSVYVLVLSGTITTAFFEALISAVKYVADPFSKLPSITYWLMGSLSNVSWQDVRTAVPLIGVGMAVLYLLRWRLNVLSLEEDEAKTSGIPVRRTRLIIIAACSLITAVSVSVCGMVGWIGLVIPHICRSIVGANNKHVLPACMAAGGAYLVLMDDLARSLTSTETPLSILTAIVGAPIFACLLRRSGGLWK